MEITRIFKAKPYDVDFGSAGWEIKLSSKELGYPDPTTPAEALDISLLMSYDLALMTYQAAVAEGLITLDQAKLKISRWKASIQDAQTRVEQRKKDAQLDSMANARLITPEQWAEGRGLPTPNTHEVEKSDDFSPPSRSSLDE